MLSTKTQRSFSTDPTLIGSLFNLLETGFPGIGEARSRSEELGITWEEGSTPFVLFDGVKVIGHVGVLELPLFLGGKKHKVGGIHAVCTRPEYRNRGHFWALMKDALRFCEQRYETLVLFTAQPELYEPFGFVTIQEFVFKTKWSSDSKSGDFRLLNLKASSDLGILHRLIETRKAVSDVLGIGPEKGVFFFNEGRAPLYYSKTMDVIASIENTGSHLHLYDIVGPRICKLSELTQKLNHRIEEVSIYFSPDQLEVSAQAEPLLFQGDSYLMVKGSLKFRGLEFMWPRSSRC